MRRKHDGWVNATHILKVANFDKPQRTRILEKEVQKGVHEKIQGGYGKYQGTWVPLEIARDLAYQYKVSDILSPLFNYKESPTSPPPPVKRAGNKPKSIGLKGRGKKGSDSPASPATRSASVATLPDSPNVTGKAKKLGTFPRDSSSTPVVKRGRGRPPNSGKAAVAAIAAGTALQKSMESPGSNLKHKMSTPSLSSKKQKLDMSPTPPGHKQRYNYSDSGSVSSRSSSPSDFLSDDDIAIPDHPTPRQTGMRTQEITDTPTFKRTISTPRQSRLKDEYSRTPNGSMPFETPSNNYNNGNSNGSILVCDNELIAAQYGRKLLDYFMAPEDDEIPDYLIHPPDGFNINHVIDDEGHTAFHWACSMGNLKIIIALLDAGANMHVVNLLGQTPLMRTVMFTNSYDLRSFSKIVELLRETIFHNDRNDRTVLHHIADSTAPRSKLSSARYYTEIFLSKLSETESMNLVESFVNRQDDKGDTALHIAARNEAKKCVKVLQSYRASAHIANKSGRTAQDYINSYESHREMSRPLQTQESVGMTTGLGGYPDHGYPQYQYPGENGYSKPVSSPTHAYTHVFSYDPASTPAGERQPVGLLNGKGHSGLPMSTPPTRISDAAVFEANQEMDKGGVTQHSSETGGSVMAKFMPLVMEKMEHLSRIYDSMIFDKKNDVEQIQQLCDNVKDDVKATEVLIQEHISNYGDEATAEQRSMDAENLVTQRIAELRKVVDRSQAKDLAELIKQEETKAMSEYQEELHRNSSGVSTSLTLTPTSSTGTSNTSTDNAELATMALELLDLQRRRREHVNEILDLWKTAGAGEKMNKYRRLVSMSCGVKIDEIDNLLVEIEQVLSETPKGESVNLGATTTVATQEH